MMLMLCVNCDADPRIDIHGGLWLWKTLIWAGMIVGFFFVPSSALYVYAQVARIGSGFFLVLQLILLIHFVYEVWGIMEIEKRRGI